MKAPKLALTILLIALSSQIHAAQMAQARLACFSLRFQTGTASGGGTLSLSSIPGTPNGELFPNGADYASGMILNILSSPVTGTMTLALPPFEDANDNGFDDFFEVAQAVGLTTTAGAYTNIVSHGTISARWSRAASSKNGTCVLTLDDNVLGLLGDFTHTFEVLEYTGPLTYTPRSSNVTTSLILTQTGSPANMLHGPALFSKTAPGDFDHLLLRAGNWTNAAAQPLSYVENEFFRDLILDTNYYGAVVFADGDPNTTVPDYRLWLLSIDDLNDADGDTIPDFSDNPSTSSPRPPVLSLALGTNDLRLTISGDVGHLHRILESTNLGTGNWLTNLSLTLTNDPQTITLPLPPGGLKFWRATAQ